MALYSRFDVIVSSFCSFSVKTCLKCSDIEETHFHFDMDLIVHDINMPRGGGANSLPSLCRRL